MANLTRSDWQRALDAQSACNLSGIVFSFAETMQRICNDVPDTGPRNAHPICVLYATQIAHLSDHGGLCDPDIYSHAVHEARIAISLYDNVDDNGDVAVAVWSRDCDMVEGTHLVHIQADYNAYLDLVDEQERNAEGSWSLTILSPEQATKFVASSRDLALEAHENGHPHCIHA